MKHWLLIMLYYLLFVLYYFVFSLPDLSRIVELLCRNRKRNLGKNFDKTFFSPLPLS